uniref:Uncharacterized protein n=1 Tax=Ditylenchus dipsaci TaxID=166011 RepID=A0A915CV00_9BILA
MLDSMNHGVKGQSAKTIILNTTRDLIRDMSQSRSWSITEKMHVPQQTNGLTVEFFALVFAIYTLRRESVSHFSQKNILTFEER